MLLEDETATRWVSAFDDAGIEFLGAPAEQLADQLGDGTVDDKSGNLDRFLKQRYLEKEFIVRLRAKGETYNGELRVKTNVLSAKPVAADLGAVEADMAALLAQLKDQLPTAGDAAKGEVAAMLGADAWQGLLGESFAMPAPVLSAMDALRAVAVA